MGRLNGKRAIVTGAGSGIGRASALLFAHEGAKVLAAGVVSLVKTAANSFYGTGVRVNQVGAFLAIKHAGRHMVAQKSGSIICTASVAGLRANAGGNPYSASKAGVISLVQTAANSFYGTGVRVNAICPGLIETGMTKPIFDFAKERGTAAHIGQLNPMNRYGEPHEIAAMAAFLASDEASYVNGQAIAVDGGLSATHPFRRPRP